MPGNTVDLVKQLDKKKFIKEIASRLELRMTYKQTQDELAPRDEERKILEQLVSDIKRNFPRWDSDKPSDCE
jgi:hypothetical protein